MKPLRPRFLVVGLCLVFHCVASECQSYEPKTRFEVRRTSEQPKRGYLAMRIRGSEDLIYVSLYADITNRDIERVSHGAGPGGGSILGIRLRRKGAERLHAITHNAIGSRLAIVVDGEVLMAPVIRAAIRDRVEISGLSAEDAESLSESLGRRR